jgi:MFS family permease
LVFAAFLVNRVLSGAAEAAASGADEALAYDSLAREGDARDWGRVLDWQIRCQAIGFMLAMSLGAAIYDPTLMQRLADWLGLGWRVTQEATLRLPLYGSLGMALVTLGITLGMKEVPDGPGHEPGRGTGRVMLDAFRLTLRAGMWIVRTPMALAVILFGLLFDHTVRMFLTLTSQYYRMIQLPEAVFGLIGSGMAMVGIFAPRLFLWLSQAHGPAFNAALLGALALAGFWGLSLVLPFWGLVPAVLLIVVMHGQGFLVSRYLNEITESRQRATVLSFKGLSYNLGYGLVGLLYSLLLALLRGRLDPALVPGALGDLENAAFIKSLGWFPWYFALLFAAFWLVSRIRLRGRP